MQNKSKMDIHILYIDDQIDLVFEEFMIKAIENYNEQSKEMKLVYNELEFSSQDIKQIIEDPKVKASDLIIIDSTLYKERHQNPLRGEHLYLEIKKIYNYKTIIMLSQESLEKKYPHIHYIKKYNSRHGENKSSEHYQKYFNEIKVMIKEAASSKDLAYNSMISSPIDKKQQEDIINNIESTPIYDDFNSNDISKIIGLFNEIRGLIDDKIK